MMQNTSKKRICLITRSLGEGGLERMVSLQSQYLHNLGYSVYIISVLNKIDYPYSGTLLNLGKLKDKTNTELGRWKRFKVLKKFIKGNNIDLIIDHRTRVRWLSETILSQFVFKQKVIYVMHSYKLSNYFPFKAKFLNRFYAKSKRIVAVSKAIKTAINKNYNIHNVSTIYNPIDTYYIDENLKEKLNYNGNFILWYGRLDNDVKNLSLLINAYKSSNLKNEGYKLILLGNGKDKLSLKEYVTSLSLQDDVIFKPFNSNPFKYIKKAKFVMLTSRHEGFPMVIPESLYCSTPVISVDCKSGPNEIIKHKHNGLLVENYNEMALANAMNEFVDNKSLHAFCKENTKSSVSHLHINNIAKQWQKIID